MTNELEESRVLILRAIRENNLTALRLACYQAGAEFAQANPGLTDPAILERRMREFIDGVFEEARREHLN